MDYCQANFNVNHALSIGSVINNNYNNLKLRMLDCFCFSASAVQDFLLEIGCPRPTRVLFKWNPDVEFSTFNDLLLAETALRDSGHPFIRIYDNDPGRKSQNKRMQDEHAETELPWDERKAEEQASWNSGCRPYRPKVYKRLRSNGWTSHLPNGVHVTA